MGNKSATTTARKTLTQRWGSPIPAGKKVLFVVGLHRSATTLLSSILATHPDCSGFKNTGAPMDEGQFLQNVYLSEDGSVLDGVGSLALRRRNRLTEHSFLATEKNANALWRCWAKHWDLERKVLIEKSPGNLTKMRFLATLFPESHFIVISRHPIAQAMAIRKWVGNRSMIQHISNWSIAYKMARHDAAILPNVTIIRYEDLCASPKNILTRVCDLIEIDGSLLGTNEFHNTNPKYFKIWRERLRSPKGRLEEFVIRLLLSNEPRAWGYYVTSKRLNFVRKPKFQM